MKIILERICYKHLTRVINVFWTNGEDRFDTTDTWHNYPKSLTPEQILSLYPSRLTEKKTVLYRASSKLLPVQIIENNRRYYFPDPDNDGGGQSLTLVQKLEKIAEEMFFANKERLLYISDKNSFMLNEIELEIVYITSDASGSLKFFSPSTDLSSSSCANSEVIGQP